MADSHLNGQAISDSHAVGAQSGLRFNLLAAAAVLLSGAALADPIATGKAADAPASAPSLYDSIWKLPKLFENDESAILQSFEFTGRFQLDYATLPQDDYHEWVIRRFRLGGKARLFQDFRIQTEVDLSPQHGPLYVRLTDAYLAWLPRRDLEFTVGKRSAPFTMDGSTSSRELLTIDRANVANNLWFSQEYIPGVTVSGTPGRWQYRLGLYTSGGANPEFGNFDGKYFILTTLGYDFAQRLGVRDATLAADYVYQAPDPNNTFTKPLEQVASLHFKFEAGKWGFRTDLSGGLGSYGQSDLWGTYFMPFYNVTRQLQVVARYSFLQSADPNGVQFARYENQVVSGRGDQYQEFYVGLNYYFYGHRLKVQTGAQYAEMRDQANDGGQYYGWAWTTGLRISW